MTRLEEVVAAFENGDELAVRRLGWWEPWSAAATWWAPKQKCTAKQFVPFARVLGDQDPARVLDAFKALAGEWRPSPAHVLGHLNGIDGNRRQTNPAGAGDRPSRPDAIAAVARALAAGEDVCACDGSPGARKWRLDAEGVLRCPNCRGLEQGQAYDAEDLESAEEKAS
jgi:hypothetical protein